MTKRLFFILEVAEMRRLLDFVFPDGIPAGNTKPDDFNPPDDEPIDDEDMPPRQKGLWD